MIECIFCQLNKENFLYETDELIVVKDIKPKARTHYLIIPKKHIESVDKLEDKDVKLMGELFIMAKRIAEKENIVGYKLIVNVGRVGGQIIDHIHMHLLAN